MRVVFDYPPMFDEIDEKFDVRGKSVIYAWGQFIYNPMRIVIPKQLLVHEAVHGQRQGSDIEGWWRRYIEDEMFRLAEEIPAHRAEYECLLSTAKNRNQRRMILKATANRLSSPLYGRMITRAKAVKELRYGT